MKYHTLKLRIEFCDLVYTGVKCFEVRKNDRDYRKGDIVLFQAISEGGIRMNHAINGIHFQITYVLSGWGIKDGYVVFGIKKA